MDHKKLLRKLTDDQLRANVRSGDLVLLVRPYMNVTEKPEPFPADQIDRYDVARNDDDEPLELTTSGNPPGGVSSLTFQATKYLIAGMKMRPASAAEKRARAWFRSEVGKVLAGTARKQTRDDYARHAQVDLGCPMRRFRERVWKQDAPPDWQEAGHPKT